MIIEISLSSYYQTYKGTAMTMVIITVVEMSCAYLLSWIA